MPYFNPVYIWPLFFLAVLIDIFIGEPPSFLHPVVWMGNFISKTSVAADRTESKSGRFAAGIAVVISGLVAFVTVPVILFQWQNVLVPGSLVWIVVSILLVWLLTSSFSLSGLLKAAGLIKKELDDDKLHEARRLTARHLVSRDTSELSEEEVSAAVIESLSENLTDSVVSPWFFLAAGGPAAAVGYRFINTCDSMLGYRNEKYEWLGKFAARFDDVVNFIPARIGGLIICFSALVLKGFSGRKAFKAMIHEHRVTSSPNAGWTMAAAAGALQICLVKNDNYKIDGGEDLPVISDIGRAVLLIKTAMLVTFILFSATVFVLGGLFL